VPERRFHGRVIAREVGIAIEYEEPLRQQRQRLADGARGSQQHRSIEAVVDADPELGAVLKTLLNALSQMTYQKHHPPDAAVLEELKLVP
jgi:hypothetical protein